jgi:methionyl-tRNA synthetase
MPSYTSPRPHGCKKNTAINTGVLYGAHYPQGNYFFKLSAYEEQIMQLLQKEGFVEPTQRRNEVSSWLDIVTAWQCGIGYNQQASLNISGIVLA